jgi:hypothetical protein
MRSPQGGVLVSDEAIGAAYLADALRNFRSYKKLAEEALLQTSDEDIFRLIDPEANSIAVIIKHMAGNMRSRWTDFLTSDGEKPDRHRDREFELDLRPRARTLCNGGRTDGRRSSRP